MSSPPRAAVSSVGMVNGFDATDLDAQPRDIASMIERRNRLLGPGYQLFYTDPIELTHAEGVHLYASDGTEYLDAYNNVAQIGHCHPRVVEAVSRQLANLNTNTRYLQEPLLDLAEQLLAHFPPALDRVTLTCTGSEANDLATRIAHHHTGSSGIIVTANAYHGVTSSVAAYSPSLGAGERPGPNVRTIAAPNPARFADEAELIAAVRSDVRRAADDLVRTGHGVSACLIDTVLSSDGVFTHPTGVLRALAEEVRSYGAVMIADEVQAGFGRTGDDWWGFARHGFVPDIVTMGKPMGNGYPVAAVVLRAEVGQGFESAVRYFNTFGGSTAAAAAARAVIGVIEEEDLIERSRLMGASLGDALRDLARDTDLIGAVRGVGMFYGVELSSEGGPVGGARMARKVVDRMRRAGVLISASGPHGNVLKIRPPLTFEQTHVDRLVEALAAGLKAAEPSTREV
ncbi:aspartate aminotransferase family protein [Nocardioides panzhihuensis]|uniref:4-aminobutyrate aminotransferase-like enzyme n=1 Tax=Nocardioides panzhihuensis TaxID=860243 RepID=A0A7Z0DHT0_9ACTN|nr:aspartate aminotransferase family protein [Nocardioides panzhihuensis]NYI75839.1 4-aminobutyrate aminotransferase-like enzyme [Nocardioides panzhihuensis]